MSKIRNVIIILMKYKLYPKNEAKRKKMTKYNLSDLRELLRRNINKL